MKEFCFEDCPVPYNVSLTMVDNKHYEEIIRGISLRFYSTHNSFSNGNFKASFNNINSEIELNFEVTNIGNVDSYNTIIILLIWFNNDEFKLLNFGKPNIVMSKLSKMVSINIKPNNYLPHQFNEISNLYLFTFDPIYDKLESEILDFLNRIKKIDKTSLNWQNDILEINPCRYSPKVISYNLSNNPFTIVDNNITHNNSGFMDVFRTQNGAAISADFGICNITDLTKNKVLINNIISKNQNEILATVTYEKNELIFYLQSYVGGAPRYSNNPNHCRITEIHNGVLELRWNDSDGSDGLFTDFYIYICHR